MKIVGRLVNRLNMGMGKTGRRVKQEDGKKYVYKVDK